ncbi:bifunctional metallophosphatase/5'-nucleotidase [Lactococcus termiticola]|uniref:5'-nucleotidase n=1 Tax=Lactococcus termiticola TaxID=2169526 RepID=A0A2R5HFL1_9LACT|nr:bifunctional UDP-sugar hydrolase/5'-nucleotidase [Lactococcus termiticola]GBG96849.1 5'-nucleotidase [Lactococcus termiticola]
MNSLRILHLNDLHSHFENFPVIERFFAEKSEEATGDVLRFDLGDNVDRAHPLTEATAGRSNIELMNRLGLTAATIGNNEGLGLTHEMLSHLYDQANFDVLLSNLTNTPFGQGPKIIETSWGMKVGIIGLTAPYDRAYPLAGWDLRYPMDVLEELLPLDCDFTILLSHLGKPRDEEIAERFPEIDLIIGSHTHHLFEDGSKANETLLAAAGRYGEHVGLIDLDFEGNQLVDSRIHAYDTQLLPDLPGDKERVSAWEDEGHKLLQQVQFEALEEGLTNTAPDYPASHYLAERFCEQKQVPAMLLASGLLVTDYLPAELDLDMLHDFLPHSIRLVKFTFTGDELSQALAEITQNASFMVNQTIQGMGFRGKVFGELILHNLTFEEGKASYLGQPVEANETYEVLMPDQYLFARYFPILKGLGHAEILFPDFLRECFAHALKKKENHA